jgi:predicted metal-dependent HD superfamily phosphohydrolase
MLGVSDSYINGIIGLIMATTHSGGLTNQDEQLIADIDLAGFGQSYVSFAADSSNIRGEYCWVDENQFRKERARILGIFDSRDPLYYTPFFRERYEAKAHENLKLAIKALTG